MNMNLETDQERIAQYNRLVRELSNCNTSQKNSLNVNEINVEQNLNYNIIVFL